MKPKPLAYVAHSFQNPCLTVSNARLRMCIRSPAQYGMDTMWELFSLTGSKEILITAKFELFKDKSGD